MQRSESTGEVNTDVPRVGGPPVVHNIQGLDELHDLSRIASRRPSVGPLEGDMG